MVDILHRVAVRATSLLSLREHLEAGAGRPRPHDLTIDDWG